MKGSYLLYSLRCIIKANFLTVQAGILLHDGYPQVVYGLGIFMVIGPGFQLRVTKTDDSSANAHLSGWHNTDLFAFRHGVERRFCRGPRLVT